MVSAGGCYVVFFFNDTATTEIYTLSLHDALPICPARQVPPADDGGGGDRNTDLSSGAAPQGLCAAVERGHYRDRKSTRLNSSYANISYAVFCLKKKKNLSTPFPL